LRPQVLPSLGLFGAGRQRLGARDSKLVIEADAPHRKFVHEVDHVSFSGAYASRRGQRALYIAERCVFALRPDGLERVEVAPGGFLCMKLGEALERRGVAPHIFESADEAAVDWRGGGPSAPRG
jgi:acyl CoA:acetate/3-ketoacid CoA transferase